MSIPSNMHPIMRSRPNRLCPMPSFLLTAVLIAWAGPVFAGWVAIDKRDQPAGLETLYFDPE